MSHDNFTFKSLALALAVVFATTTAAWSAPVEYLRPQPALERNAPPLSFNLPATKAPTFEPDNLPGELPSIRGQDISILGRSDIKVLFETLPDATVSTYWFNIARELESSPDRVIGFKEGASTTAGRRQIYHYVGMLISFYQYDNWYLRITALELIRRLDNTGLRGWWPFQNLFDIATAYFDSPYLDKLSPQFLIDCVNRVYNTSFEIDDGNFSRIRYRFLGGNLLKGVYKIEGLYIEGKEFPLVVGVLREAELGGLTKGEMDGMLEAWGRALELGCDVIPRLGGYIKFENPHIYKEEGGKTEYKEKRVLIVAEHIERRKPAMSQATQKREIIKAYLRLWHSTKRKSANKTELGMFISDPSDQNVVFTDKGSVKILDLDLLRDGYGIEKVVQLLSEWIPTLSIDEVWAIYNEMFPKVDIKERDEYIERRLDALAENIKVRPWKEEIRSIFKTYRTKFSDEEEFCAAVEKTSDLITAVSKSDMPLEFLVQTSLPIVAATIREVSELICVLEGAINLTEARIGPCPFLAYSVPMMIKKAQNIEELKRYVDAICRNEKASDVLFGNAALLITSVYPLGAFEFENTSYMGGYYGDMVQKSTYKRQSDRETPEPGLILQYISITALTISKDPDEYKLTIDTLLSFIKKAREEGHEREILKGLNKLAFLCGSLQRFQKAMEIENRMLGWLENESSIKTWTEEVCIRGEYRDRHIEMTSRESRIFLVPFCISLYEVCHKIGIDFSIAIDVIYEILFGLKIDQPSLKGGLTKIHSLEELAEFVKSHKLNVFTKIQIEPIVKLPEAEQAVLRPQPAFERGVLGESPSQRPIPAIIRPLFDFSEVLSKAVIIFPSPSDAKPGMGRELYENYETARRVYDRAARALGYKDVARLFLKEEDRGKTEFYTICTVVYSIVMYELLSEKMGRKIRPLATTGSSAGQVASEIISGAISLEEGLRMLQAQSGIFSEAAKKLDYAIFRVVGAAAEAIRPALRFGEIEIVQDASPAFITIAVKRGVDFEKLRDEIKSLDTTGKARIQIFDPPLYKAPHNSFYDPYKKEVLDFISGMEVKDPEFPIISTVTGQLLTTASQVRKDIEDQFFRGVLWRGAINAAVDNGAILFIELSPGDKLTRLNEYLAPNTPSAALANPAESAKLNTALLRAYLGEAWYQDLPGFIADVTAGKVSKAQATALVGSISLEECEAAHGQLKRIYQYARVDIDAFPEMQRNKILFLRAVANRMNKDSGIDLEDVGIGNTIFYNTEAGKTGFHASGEAFSKTAGKTLESQDKDLKRLCEIETWRVLMSSHENRKKMLAEITGRLPDFNGTLTTFFNDGRRYAAADVSAVKGGAISSWKRGAICVRIKAIADDLTERAVYLKTGNVAIEGVIREIYTVIGIPTSRGVFREGPLSYELLEDIKGRTLDKVPAPEKDAKKEILGYQMGRKLFADMCFLIGEGIQRNNILDANDRVVRVDLDVALQKGLLTSEVNPLSGRFTERVFLTANRFFPDREKLRQSIELFRPYFGNFAGYLAETAAGQDTIALEALLDGPVKEGFLEVSKAISGDFDKLRGIVEVAMSRGVATSPSLDAIEKDIPAHIEEWARMDPLSLEVFFNYVVKPAIVIHCLYFEALSAVPASRLRGDKVDEIYEYINARYTRHEQAIAASRKQWSLDINGVIDNVMPAFGGDVSRERLEGLIRGITQKEYNRNYGELKACYEGSRFEITNFSEEKREALVLLKILADKYDTVTGVDTSRVLAADTLFFNLPLAITKPKDLSAEFSLLTDAGNKDFTRLILSTLWRIKEGRNTAGLLEKNIDALCEGIGPSLVDVLGPGDWKIARVSGLGGGNAAIWKHSFVFSIFAAAGNIQKEIFVKTGDFRIQDAHRKINELLGLPAYNGITCVRDGGRSFEIAERIDGIEGYRLKGKIPAGTENEVFKSLGRHAFYNLSFSVGDTHRRNDLIKEDGSIARIDTEVSLQPGLLASEKALLSGPLFEKFISENLSEAETLGLTRQDMERLCLLAIWINLYMIDLKENISREECAALIDNMIKAGFTELAAGLRSKKGEILGILERAVSEKIPTYPTKAPLNETEIARVSRWASLTDTEASGIFSLLRKALLQREFKGRDLPTCQIQALREIYEGV